MYPSKKDLKVRKKFLIKQHNILLKEYDSLKEKIRLVEDEIFIIKKIDDLRRNKNGW